MHGETVKFTVRVTKGKGKGHPRTGHEEPDGD